MVMANGRRTPSGLEGENSSDFYRRRLTTLSNIANNPDGSERTRELARRAIEADQRRLEIAITRETRSAAGVPPVQPSGRGVRQSGFGSRNRPNPSRASVTVSETVSEDQQQLETVQRNVDRLTEIIEDPSTPEAIRDARIAQREANLQQVRRLEDRITNQTMSDNTTVGGANDTQSQTNRGNTLGQAGVNATTGVENNEVPGPISDARITAEQGSPSEFFEGGSITGGADGGESTGSIQDTNRGTRSNQPKEFSDPDPLGLSVGGPFDKRVRIRARPNQETEVYGARNPTNPMNILHQTQGVIFPYTPIITYTQTPNWASQSLTHSIQEYYYFTGTSSTTIQITGAFTAQNEQEARYLLAVFHFFRSYSKMYFGRTDPKRGLPPPMLILDGYGDYMLNGLPILIRTWNFELLNDVDYVKVNIGGSRGSVRGSNGFNVPTPKTGVPAVDNAFSNAADSVSGFVESFGFNSGNVQDPSSVNSTGGFAYVPAMTNILIEAVVQQPPARLRNQFNLNKFRNGELLGSNAKGYT